MARFTEWRKIADKDTWDITLVDRGGPACYELGVGFRRDRVRVKYVGETCSERRRMQEYANYGSHLREFMTAELECGAKLYYRAQALPSKAAAARRQDNLLARWRYEWNRQLNRLSNPWDRRPPRR